MLPSEWSVTKKLLTVDLYLLIEQSLCRKKYSHRTFIDQNAQREIVVI